MELVLSTQLVEGHLKQSEELLAAVLNSVGSLCTFRLGANDAKVLLKDIFFPDFDKQIKATHLRPVRLFGGTVIEREHVYRSVEEIWELEARKIQTLPDRTFYYKRRGQLETHLLATPSVMDVEKLPNAQELGDLRIKLENAIRSRYGVSKITSKDTSNLHRRDNDIDDNEDDDILPGEIVDDGE